MKCTRKLKTEKKCDREHATQRIVGIKENLSCKNTKNNIEQKDLFYMVLFSFSSLNDNC